MTVYNSMLAIADALVQLRKDGHKIEADNLEAIRTYITNTDRENECLKHQGREFSFWKKQRPKGMEELIEELGLLRDFIDEVLRFDEESILRDLAVEHGLMTAGPLVVPCSLGELCMCVEIAEVGETVQCYTKTKLLTGEDFI